MDDKRILISGAGIAGPALAYWLHRQGCEVTVVERSAGPRVGGQAVDIRGSAREVLENMGLSERVREHHTGTRGIAYIDSRGRTRACLDNAAFGHSGGVIAELEILRDDLVRILLDASGPRIEYMYDDSITSIEQTVDAVHVTFERGADRDFDVLVGADGIRSNVRAQVFGDHEHFVRDLGYYSAYFAAHTDEDHNGWEYAYSIPAGNGVGGRLVMAYPLGDTDELRAMFNFSSTDLGIDHGDLVAQKTLLHRVFEGSGWKVDGLLDQMRDADLYFARVGGVEVGTFFRGRVVLLGDAISGGSLGMGTSMALVEAYVLAQELANGRYEQAFARYQHRLAGFVAANQKRPPGSDRGFLPRTRAGIGVRNMVMRALPHMPGAARVLGDTQSRSTLDLSSGATIRVNFANP